jgi:hypothetical protein
VNHWWRAYNEAVNDPKLQLISDLLFRAWFNLMCVASANDGILPAVNDLAFTLRMKPDQVAKVLTQLHSHGLLDKTETSFTPHNWSGRQYKTDTVDPTAASRAKRYRDRKRDDRDATVTDKRPEAEQKQTTEQSRDVRSDLQKRAGNFRQAIVKAFEDANSPTMIETSRAELWLTQGYQEDICLAVISEIVRKKPSITTLNYFDNAIKDAHSSKAPPRQAVSMQPEEINWDQILTDFKKFGRWSKWAGPDLDSPACRAPKEMLEKYGLELRRMQ